MTGKRRTMEGAQKLASFITGDLMSAGLIPARTQLNVKRVYGKYNIELKDWDTHTIRETFGIAMALDSVFDTLNVLQKLAWLNKRK